MELEENFNALFFFCIIPTHLNAKKISRNRRHNVLHNDENVPCKGSPNGSNSSSGAVGVRYSTLS